MEWYASNRDLPEPGFCELKLYTSWKDVLPLVRRELASADVAMVGSYFPDGIAAVTEMLDSAAAVRTFYDIDTPITMAALRERGASDYLRADQIAALDVYFSFTAGRCWGSSSAALESRRAVPLYCSFDPERYRAYPPSERFACAMSYMGTYAPDRQPKLEDYLFGAARALPEMRFTVAGPQYPKDGDVAAERASYRAFQSALASAFVFVFAADAEHYAARYGDGRLFAVGAAV